MGFGIERVDHGGIGGDRGWTAKTSIISISQNMRSVKRHILIENSADRACSIWANAFRKRRKVPIKAKDEAPFIEADSGTMERNIVLRGFGGRMASALTQERSL